jgi:hypothetical protein
MQGKLQKSPKNLQLEHNPLAKDLPDGKENDEKKEQPNIALKEAKEEDNM